MVALIFQFFTKRRYSRAETTLDSGINIGVRFLIFGFFPGATSLLKRAKNSEILLFDEVGSFF